MDPPPPKFVLRGSLSSVSSLSFLTADSENENIKLLASGSQDGDCSIWNLKERCLERHWKAHKSSVLWLKSVTLNSLWTCGRSDAVIHWDLGCGTSTELTQFPIQNYLGFSQCDLINHNFRSLLVCPGSSQESINLWDTNANIKVCTLKPYESELYGSVMQCQFLKHNDNIYILSIYDSGHVLLWDINTLKVLSQIKCDDNPVSLMFDDILKKGVFGTASENVYTFMLNESFLLEFELTYKITNPGVGCLSYRSDQKIYAAGGWDYRIRVFSWKKHKPLAVLAYHKKSIESIQFSKGPVESLSEGYLLAAGSSDASISLWDIFN